MTDPHSLRQAAEQAVSDVPLPDTIGVVREGHDGFPWKSIAEHHEAARIEIGTEVCAMPDVRDYGRACALAAMAAPVPLPLPKVDGDILPAIGSKVLIHLGSQDEWVEHTVVGYYVWPNHGLTASVFRVFVRVRDKGGSLNARCLQDIRYPDEPSPAEPQPVQAPSDLPEMIDAIITRLRSLRQSTPNTASSIWDVRLLHAWLHALRRGEAALRRRVRSAGPARGSAPHVGGADDANQRWLEGCDQAGDGRSRARQQDAQRRSSGAEPCAVIRWTTALPGSVPCSAQLGLWPKRTNKQDLTDGNGSSCAAWLRADAGADLVD